MKYFYLIHKDTLVWRINRDQVSDNSLYSIIRSAYWDYTKSYPRADPHRILNSDIYDSVGEECPCKINDLTKASKRKIVADLAMTKLNKYEREALGLTN